MLAGGAAGAALIVLTYLEAQLYRDLALLYFYEETYRTLIAAGTSPGTAAELARTYAEAKWSEAVASAALATLRAALGLYFLLGVAVAALWGLLRRIPWYVSGLGLGVLVFFVVKTLAALFGPPLPQPPAAYTAARAAVYVGASLLLAWLNHREDVRRRLLLQ